MKGSLFVLEVIFFLQLVIVIAGNDVTTFNQDDFDEDNIDSVLETEHLIQVVDRRNSRLSNNFATKEEYLSQPKIALNSSSQDLPTSHIQSGANVYFQDLNRSLQLDVDNVTDLSNRNMYYSKPRTTADAWTALTHWDDLSSIQEESENELFALDNGGFQESLSRNKRDLVAGSGDTVSKTEFTLNQKASRGKRATPQATDVQFSLKRYLEKYFQNKYGVVEVQTEVTALVYPKVSADLKYPDNILINDVAQALYDLQTNSNVDFMIGSAVYEILFVKLQNLADLIDPTLRPIICFFCERYEKCQENLLSQLWKCIIGDTRLYPFGSDERDIPIPPDDEFYAEKIRLPIPITYDNQLVNTIFVSANGLISFDQKYSSYSPVPCPVYVKGQRIKILAPYWTDLDKGRNDKGQVFSNVYVRTSGMSSRVKSILDKASRDVVLHTGERTYTANIVVKITWSDMPPWPIRPLDNERVTFQCLIISNGETTYAIYLYAQRAMNLNPILRRNVAICAKDFNLDLARSNYYRFDTVMGNTGNIGQWAFLLGRLPNSRAKCFEWFESNVPFLTGLNIWNQFIIPQCPCSEINTIFSFQWIPSRQPGCYDLFPSFGQIGRRCCYRRDGSLSFENREPASGNLQLYTPYYGDLANHEINDALPKRWCCYESDLCYLYYIARPVRSCVFRWTWRGSGIGDPHIKTIDGRSFIFNGLGEFTLLEINGRTSDNKTVDFKLQGRACQAKNNNGTLSNATVFCAFAMGKANQTVQVEIHSSGNYMVIYVNGQDFTARFRDTPAYNNSAGGFYFKKINNSLSVSTPDDVGLTVSLSNNLLDFTVEIDGKFRNMTTGLMGNFNGDPADDFIFPNGTALPNSTSERQLFEYGKTWAVKESIFSYSPGTNSSTFSDPNFQPIYLEEINGTVLEEAKSVCKGTSNLPCIFDYAVTRNEQLATNSKDTSSSFDKQETEFSNRPPVINGTLQMYVTVNKTSTLTITGSDPDNDVIYYILVDKPSSGFNYTNSSSVFIADYMPTDVKPVSIGVAAKDDKGLESEVSEVFIITCSGCNYHGKCNVTELRNTTDPYFSLASCDCDSPYSGDDCEFDNDGCANSPCPEDTNCTDVPAIEETSTGIAYNCSNCPKGFNLNDTKCEDDDECQSRNACSEHAKCTNTYGSYICSCIHGYRKTTSGKCIDINECVENQHNCEQICTNTDGSYNCSCHEGYTSNRMNRFTCIKNAIDPCQNLTHKNCSYGCETASGIAQCFCETGKRLADDGVSCTDINECEENLCSQNCNNTEGSYSCSCFSGYYLLEDKLSCERCADGQYGMECMSTCNCLGRAKRCDNVKGCICQASWTGPNCEIDVDECVNLIDPCPNDQICINTNGSFTCDCPDGYYDKYSNGSCYDINECDFPAIHNCSQSCVNNPGSFTCMCTEGYNQVNNLCQDINECDLGISGCEQNCVNKEGSFNCLCHLGYVLADDRKGCIKDVEPCRDFNITCDYACDIVGGLPDCYCQVGYIRGTDNKTCIDINECEDGSQKCSDKCENTRGSYNCSCSDGSQLLNDKRSCEKCDNYHWGPDCNNVCNCNLKGSLTCDPIIGCVCQPGWGGATCNNDKDECSQNQTVCSVSSKCINTIGSYICQCKEGFELDNNVCSDIDECVSSPCDHICNNTIGSYICSCFNGFVSNGDKCLDINECELPSLSNCDQLCRNTEGGFACECYDGYILNTTTRNTCYRDPLAQTCGVAAKCSDICTIQNGMEICSCRPGYELGADNSSCINVNECLRLRDPCVDGNCTDLNGTFGCACGSGFKLGADGVTCKGCDFWSYGLNCNNTCTCKITNTEKCLATDGTCQCLSGWNGTTCSEDIDECYDSSKNNCGVNAHCKNSPGTYSCICNEGFYRTSNGDCIPCDATHYGQDCLSTCSCITANTRDCDDVTGKCTCKMGWEGSSCDMDINECSNSSSCPNVHESCFNLNGTYECKCKSGYDKIDDRCQDINECLNPTITTCTHPQKCNNTDGGFECICEPGYQNVSGQCTDIDECSNQTVATCTDMQDCINTDGDFMCICKTGYQDVNGQCICKTGYQNVSGQCMDIDECLNSTVTTCTDPQVCNNTDGGFECICKTGYQNVSGQCITNFRTYTVNISLMYDKTEILSLGNIFNSSSEDFRRFAEIVEISLFNYGKVVIPRVLLGVKITNFYLGSVITNTNVYIDEKNSTNPQADAAKLKYNLIRTKELDINGKNVTIGNDSSTFCDIYTSLGPCSEGQTCVEENDSVKCSPYTSLKEAQTNLIIGLAVGIPLFILLIIAVALFAILYVRRKRKSEQQSSSQSVDHGAPFRNVFATRTSTKGSWGAPHQMYAPDFLSDVGTNESGNGSLNKTRQKGRSDFQDSAWYDNRGATSSGAPDSREASTEAVGPTSNFSWEYMFRLLEPHRDFEIQRPNYETRPNPTFISRNKQPDSAA